MGSNRKIPPTQDEGHALPGPCWSFLLSAGPGPRFTCEECVHEMRELAFMIKFVAKDIQDYLTANYCPTLPEDDHACEHDLAHHYIGMLYSVVTHFFVDGAVHICQTAGTCDAAKQREYTCDECIEGLQWVAAYMEDPIMVAEMVVYLQQNFCTDQMHHCHDTISHHFPPMHAMAMEKFMIPTEICMQEPVCGATKPPM